MTISNSDQFKDQLKTGIPIILCFLSIVLILLSIIFFTNGHSNYKIQLMQKD